MPDRILVECADDDAKVIGEAIMKPDEIKPIEREQGALFGNGEGENVVIGYRPASVADFDAGAVAMPRAT